MPTAWLPGVYRVPNAKSEGGTYLSTPPWRFVGHTTEVVPTSIAGAVALAGRHAYPPHLWAWPERDWLVQTVRLDRAAFALKHPSGVPETNKMRALQVEVIGYAKDMPSKSDGWLEWLGVNVVRRLIDAGYPINLNHVAPTTGNDGSGTGGRVRMTRTQWRVWDGLCVHANVPDNTHWDMGAINLDKVADAARLPDPEPTPEPPAPIEGDPLPMLYTRINSPVDKPQRLLSDHGKLYVCHGASITVTPTTPELRVSDEIWNNLIRGHGGAGALID